MNMIEKVARAMCADDSGPEGSTQFDFHWEEVGHCYMSNARAALNAMREPSDAMKEAFDRDFEEWFSEEIEDQYHLYKIMIDAALKEAGE